MTAADHETYASELRLSLSHGDPDPEPLTFIPNPTQTRNAAKAVAAILCRRLMNSSGEPPIQKESTTYEWKVGVFNCRCIADRNYLWTNLRRGVADGFHDIARGKPFAYLFACSDPSETTLFVWAIPEPVLNECLSRLPLKEGGNEYSLEIRMDNQRIEHCDNAPDLTPFCLRLALTQNELSLLADSRQADTAVKSERARARAKGDSDNGDSAVDPVTRNLLATLTDQLNEAGAFDADGIVDARERVLSSIVRRRGQQAFRERLLASYEARCAISECNVEAVLDAAHIVPYRGPGTNHPCNGLLLRNDLHTLFDLKLLAVDETTMSLLVAPSLAGTEYEAYRGKPIRLPVDPESQPSREALSQHRQESGL